MLKCTECGYENLDGLDYCDSCGAKLAAAPGEATPPAPPPASDAPTGEIPPTPTVEPAAAPAAPESHPEPSAAPQPEAAPAAEPVPAPEPTHAPETAPAAAAPQPAAAVPPSFKAKLKIVRGGRQGHEFPLEGGNNLVGRWDPETGAFPEVDLEADDPEAKISRKHALIRLDGAVITIEDIGSLNGTYVNRQPRLAPGTPHDLKDGDEIIVGKTFFKVIVEPVS